MSRAEQLEWVLILLALVSLWPYVFGYRPLWYRVLLLGVLAVMVWVAVRRWRRLRSRFP